MELPEFLQDKNTQKIVLLIAIFAVIMWLKPKEKFEGFVENKKDNILEMHVDDIPIQPAQVMPNIYTVMSGSGFIPQKEVMMPWKKDKYGANDALDDGDGGNMGLSTNLCSPSCCSDQWPTPHKLPYDKFVCGSKDKYVPTNYTCNNAFQSSGCLCMKKSQAAFLFDRGNNA